MRCKHAYLLAFCVALGACPGRTREPEKSQKRVDLAADLLAQGQDAAAESEIRKALAFDPENEEAYLVLGLIHTARAQRNVMLIEYDDCQKGTIGEGLRREADEHMRQAEQSFAKATELAPDYGEAWQNRAVVASYFKDWPKAVEFGTRALANLARLKNEALARANLGWAFYHQRDYTRASTELLQATQREVGFCLGNYRLAAVLFDRGEPAAAIERIEPFLDDPRSCPIQEMQYLAGQAYLRVHQRERAAQAFQRCLDLGRKSCLAPKCERALHEIGN